MNSKLIPVPEDRTVRTVAGLPVTEQILTIGPAIPQRTLAELEQAIRDALASTCPQR